MPILFGLTMFVSATLLFLVQPMVGKMILPLIGGTPAVWNTCMVFFQALLLLGYYYAHKTTGLFPTRTQVGVHTVVLLIAVGVLAAGAALTVNHSPVPIAKTLAPQGSAVPFFGVILLLAVAIGLPFFAVATTAPLLQKWFSETGHPSAKDPYFLYAASNFGSLLALVAYPFVVEPNLRLVEQAWIWAGGFAVLVGMIVVCGRAVATAPPYKLSSVARKGSAAHGAGEDFAPTRATRIRWLLLAAVPSSLMLAVTTDVTVDMISMPLIWIVPLSLYLITFIVVFSKCYTSNVHMVVTLLTPVLILLVVYIKIAKNVPQTLSADFQVFLVVQLLTFFAVAMMCHGELARTRPSAKWLTTFYLTMSLGGMLGGMFNALFSPVVFTFITEYPISLIAACLLLPSLRTLSGSDADQSWSKFSIMDVALPLVFFFVARLISANYEDVYKAVVRVFERLDVELTDRMLAKVVTVVGFAPPVLACYLVVERPRRFAACVAAMWLATFITYYRNDRAQPDGLQNVYTRSYFGTLRITPGARYTSLVHGVILHGMQHTNSTEYSVADGLLPLGIGSPWELIATGAVAQENWQFPGRLPLTYYHRTGPVGDMFEAFWDRNVRTPNANTDVACIGLGTGSLSAYGLPGQRMTFFEIDATVRRLVEPPKYFTYIDSAKRQGVDIEFLMGDARLTLEQTPDRKWGFMLVDAFSSDAIPAHLLTEEALRLYFERLDVDGIVAIHISNRYMNLEPVVERIVRELGYEARVMSDDDETAPGKSRSTWVAVGRTPASLGMLLTKPHWKALKANDRVGLWTDDYTPILNVLQGDWDLFGTGK